LQQGSDVVDPGAVGAEIHPTIDAAALAVTQTPQQVVKALDYAINGTL